MPASGCRYACSCHDVVNVPLSTMSALATRSPRRLCGFLVQQHVRPARGMHELRARFERAQRVAHNREIGVVHLDQCRTARSRLRILRDDQRDAVARITHALAAQHFLIRVDQAVAVVRHVRGRQHGHDARQRARPRRVDAIDRRVRAVREHRLAVQHVRAHEVRRVLRRAGHLRARVGARDRRADQAHALTAAGCGSRACISRAPSSIASRILR